MDCGETKKKRTVWYEFQFFLRVSNWMFIGDSFRDRISGTVLVFRHRINYGLHVFKINGVAFQAFWAIPWVNF